jgi:hypothetical protein
MDTRFRGHDDFLRTNVMARLKLNPVESGDWGCRLASEEESKKSAMGPFEAAIEKEMPAYFHLKPEETEERNRRGQVSTLDTLKMMMLQSYVRN